MVRERTDAEDGRVGEVGDGSVDGDVGEEEGREEWVVDVGSGHAVRRDA